MQGYISSYESFATMEGPGIRFAVFMSGCNLRCAYCHNPDTWRQGKSVNSNELIKLILRYKPYFRGGGGVTFSGGEPLTQTAFVAEVADKLKKEGVHIVLDTSCGLLGESQKKLYNLCDLVIADLKFSSGALYAEYCKNNVLDTVLATFRYLNQQKIPLWIRTVVVPDINDTTADIDAVYNLIKDLDNISKYELKPFHTMGFSKYEGLGISNPLAGTQGLSNERLVLLKKHLYKISNGRFGTP